MRKGLYLILSIFLMQFYSKIVAQELIFDMPIIGDTIDFEEKVKFVLFEEIPNNDYFFSIISERNFDTLLTHYKKSDTLEKKVNLNYISSILSNVTKLNTYYNSVEKQKKNLPGDFRLIANPNPQIIYPFEENRFDSLLRTNPASYKEILKKQKKIQKQDPNRKKWYDKNPGRIETDKNLPSYKEEQMRNIYIPMPTYSPTISSPY